MIQSSREGRRRAEDEEKGQASSRLWSSTLKNPRIVRVSRAFGGKDRHSKVRTIRGLRDRRIRLSVPTAIQLYALQDKLGLNQPSKVVDWLIAAAQHAIDELPPLEMSMIILQASNDHLAAAPQFAHQLHATMANVVPQNYMVNYAAQAQAACNSISSGGDGHLEAVLGRSGKEKETVKEASSCYPYYFHLEQRLNGCSASDQNNYPMPMFASSSSMAAAREEEPKQQRKYAGRQMAAAGSAPQDDTLNPLRSSWNRHAAGVPNSMVLQQKE